MRAGWRLTFPLASWTASLRFPRWYFEFPTPLDNTASVALWRKKKKENCTIKRNENPSLTEISRLFISEQVKKWNNAACVPFRKTLESFDSIVIWNKSFPLNNRNELLIVTFAQYLSVFRFAFQVLEYFGKHLKSRISNIYSCLLDESGKSFFYFTCRVKFNQTVYKIRVLQYTSLVTTLSTTYIARIVSWLVYTVANYNQSILQCDRERERARKRE